MLRAASELDSVMEFGLFQIPLRYPARESAHELVRELVCELLASWIA